MSEWAVRVTVATPAVLGDEALDALADLAEQGNASVATRVEGPGYSVTVHVEALDPLAAGRAGVRFARDVLGADLSGTVVDLRVTTPEQYEAEALRPDFPPLASAADAAEILGVSRQRVHQLSRSNTRFPQPVARVGSGPLWTVPAIEHFGRVWVRKPGRPHRRRDREEPRGGAAASLVAVSDPMAAAASVRSGDSVHLEDAPHRRRA